VGIQSNVQLEYVMYTRAQKELGVFLQDTRGTPENIKHIFKDTGGTHTSALRLAKCFETSKQLESPYVLLYVLGWLSFGISVGHAGR
jgi:hypothetical protein